MCSTLSEGTRSLVVPGEGERTFAAATEKHRREGEEGVDREEGEREEGRENGELWRMTGVEAERSSSRLVALAVCRARWETNMAEEKIPKAGVVSGMDRHHSNGSWRGKSNGVRG